MSDMSKQERAIRYAQQGLDPITTPIFTLECVENGIDPNHPSAKHRLGCCKLDLDPEKTSKVELERAQTIRKMVDAVTSH